MKRLLLLFLLAVAPFRANALLPESGFYWNPSLSGSGYAVEFQDDFMFISAYSYTSNGSALFYTIAGKLNVATGIVDGTLILSSGGQCFGCPYVKPVNSTVAPAQVQFTSTQTGIIRLFLPSGTVTIPIQRFLFYFYDNSQRGLQLGTWSVVTGAFGIYFGDFLYVQSFCNVSATLIDQVCGQRIDAPARILLGARLPGTSTFLVIVDSSTSYYDQYLYNFDSNRWIGLSWTYLKSSPPPTTGGLNFIATRVTGVSTANQIFTGIPPASESTKSKATLDFLDAARSEASDASMASKRLNVDRLPEGAREELAKVTPEQLEATARQLIEQLQQR
jgi:hypothetical protein